LKKVAVVSLGCSKNLVDTEYMMGLLKASGDVVFVNSLKEADIILINTCGFIKPAKEESIEEILNAIDEKVENPEKKVIVSGCLYTRYKEELSRELPEVDTFIAVNEIEKCVEKILNRKLSIRKPYMLREILTPRHLAYLKISEGCSNNCTYCAIPIIRGNLKSRDMDELIDEAKILASKGVKELYLIAQDTTAYLHDKGYKNGLIELLEKLEQIDDIKWIRLMYTYPTHITDSLIDYMASSQKLLHYFDVPFQHISNKVLSSMGRNYTSKQAWELIEKIRKRLPDATLRTTFIIGFPTEGESEFKELCSFLKDAEFDWAGFFKYSREDGTAAYKLGNLPEKVKESRLNLIEEIQYSIYEKKHLQLIGKSFPLIVDTKSEEIPGFVEARSYRNAYEVDGIVYLKGDFNPGEIVESEITDLASNVDLIAEPINDQG